MIFTKEAKLIKELFIFDPAGIYLHQIDFDNIVRASSLMSSLTSLTLCLHELKLTETAARRIKQMIHSRDQNIVLYLEDYDRTLKKSILQREVQVSCPKPSSNNFSIVYSSSLDCEDLF